MILRSPAENENGGIFLHMVVSSTRHSRARGNPDLFRRISLDTRFRGYDGSRRSPRCQIISAQVFSKEDTKSTKFGVVIIRTVRVLRGEQNKLNVAHNPHKSLKNLKVVPQGNSRPDRGRGKADGFLVFTVEEIVDASGNLNFRRHGPY